MPKIKQNQYKDGVYLFPDTETKIFTYQVSKEILMQRYFESIDVPTKYLKTFLFLIKMKDAKFQIDSAKIKFPEISSVTYRQYLFEMTKFKIEKEPLLFHVSRSIFKVNPVFIYNMNKPITLIIEFQSI